MKKLLNKEDLINFENSIVNLFKQKQIRAPIHLDHGNEEQLIEIFKKIEPNDWVCGTWRMHYRSLLKGVPRKKLRKAILDKRSIALCFKEEKIVSSAIVGGILPIALGIALDIKRKNGTEKVWVFSGEMTSETGTFHECYKYALRWELPIVFIVEDNEYSVCTKTRECWNAFKLEHENNTNLIYFKYNLHEKYPHSGIGGQRIVF